MFNPREYLEKYFNSFIGGAMENITPHMLAFNLSLLWKDSYQYDKNLVPGLLDNYKKQNPDKKETIDKIKLVNPSD